VTAVLIIAAAALAGWLGAALLLALVIGKGARIADTRERPRRECLAPVPPAVASHRKH
jgi:hypothetical protein